MTTKLQQISAEDLLWNRDPTVLRAAADLAEQLGRYAWADAMRESAEACEPIEQQEAA